MTKKKSQIHFLAFFFQGRGATVLLARPGNALDRSMDSVVINGDCTETLSESFAVSVTAFQSRIQTINFSAKPVVRYPLSQVESLLQVTFYDQH